MVKPQQGKRISKVDMYLNCAETFAYRSTCLKRKYGAVIVKDDVVISTGYNGSPRGFDSCCDLGRCPRMERDMHQGEGYGDLPGNSRRGQCSFELFQTADDRGRPVFDRNQSYGQLHSLCKALSDLCAKYHTGGNSERDYAYRRRSGPVSSGSGREFGMVSGRIEVRIHSVILSINKVNHNHRLSRWLFVNK